MTEKNVCLLKMHTMPCSHACNHEAFCSTLMVNVTRVQTVKYTVNTSCLSNSFSEYRHAGEWLQFFCRLSPILTAVHSLASAIDVLTTSQDLPFWKLAHTKSVQCSTHIIKGSFHVSTAESFQYYVSICHFVISDLCVVTPLFH